tara:strand:- start:404 stop:601 length:198 start_codon:yes stop_codon:yes gene_type:complete
VISKIKETLFRKLNSFDLAISMIIKTEIKIILINETACPIIIVIGIIENKKVISLYLASLFIKNY